MNGAAFQIRYPLFALKRDAAYVGCDMGLARKGARGFGIPVFTSEENAIAFRTAINADAKLIVFDRDAAFRVFLRSIRGSGTVVLFDLLPDFNGNPHTDLALPAAVVEGKFLPEVTWGWSYPIYLLRYGNGYACVTGMVAGKTGKWLAVFTDSDLAERAVAAATEEVVAVPVPDRGAFAAIVRGSSPDVIGAAFDPPDPRAGGRARTCLARQQLLANLAIEI